VPSKKKKPAVIALPATLEFSRDGRDVWEQQDEEPLEAFRRFSAYLSCGSTRQVATAFRWFSRLEREEQRRLEAGPAPTAVATRPGPEAASAPPDAITLARIEVGAPGEKDPPRALGAAQPQWRREYEAYRWRERAVAYDSEQFKLHARAAASDIGKLVAAMAAKLVRAVEDAMVRPATWKEWTEGIGVLAQFVPQDAARAFLPDPGDGEGHVPAGPVIDAPGPVGEGPGGLLPQRAETQPDPGARADQPDAPRGPVEGPGPG